MGHHTTEAASNAAMEVALLAHQITLHMKANFIVNITMFNSSRKKETIVNLKVTDKKKPSLRSLHPWKLLQSHSL